MSLDKSFYMDEQMALDLKQRITKVDITYIDLSLLYFEEKGKSKVMDTEVGRTINDTTIQDSANVISDKCKIRFNNIEKHHGANFDRSKKKRKEANMHWCPCGKSKGNETEVYDKKSDEGSN